MKYYKILNELGIAKNLNGYEYLRQALEIADKFGFGWRVTRDIYPAVGELMNVERSQVERCIRHAAHKASIESETIKAMFHEKVTNSLLIATILNEIKLSEMEYAQEN